MRLGLDISKQLFFWFLVVSHFLISSYLKSKIAKQSSFLQNANQMQLNILSKDKICIFADKGHILHDQRKVVGNWIKVILLSFYVPIDI